MGQIVWSNDVQLGTRGVTGQIALTDNGNGINLMHEGIGNDQALYLTSGYYPIAVNPGNDPSWTIPDDVEIVNTVYDGVAGYHIIPGDTHQPYTDLAVANIAYFGIGITQDSTGLAVFANFPGGGGWVTCTLDREANIATYPVMASLNGQMYIFYLYGVFNGIYLANYNTLIYRTLDYTTGAGLGVEKTIPNITTNYAPNVLVVGNVLYLTYKSAEDNLIHIISFDGTTWYNDNGIPNTEDSQKTPALIYLAQQFFIFSEWGLGGDVYTSTLGSSGWGEFTQVSNGMTTTGTPTFLVFQGYQVMCVHQSAGHGGLIRYSLGFYINS